MYETKTEKKNLYEVGYHLVPTIGEAGLDVEVEKVHAVLRDSGATIVSEDRAKHFSPSYPLTRSEGGKRESFDTSYAGFIKFETTREAAQEISVGLRELSSVLRFLVVQAYKEVPISRQKPRSVFSRSPKDTGTNVSEEPAKQVSKEAIDKEIEKLVVD